MHMHASIVGGVCMHACIHRYVSVWGEPLLWRVFPLAPELRDRHC